MNLKWYHFALRGAFCIGMFFLPDPNRMHDLLEPMPTLEDYGRDVLYGGTAPDRVDYA